MNGLLQSLHRCKVVLLLCILSCFFFSSKGYSATINIDATNFPDANFRNYLLSQGFGQDGVLTESEISNVKTINVQEKGISSLAGIECFTALEDLNCGKNQLTSLDVSKNTALKELICYYNELTSLDVTRNTYLEDLRCFDNKIESLDVSKNKALKHLECDDNKLTSLDVSKNTLLTGLSCGSNNLTSLDVTKNTALTSLECHSNKLTSLDVTQNTALRYLGCGSCELISLDISKNMALSNLSCGGNRLSSLDVSRHTQLETLNCVGNQLTSLDLSNNPELNDIMCYGNKLTKLVVSRNSFSHNPLWNSKRLLCNRNELKGSAMDAFINSLPNQTEMVPLHLIYNTNERNVITKTQVTAAKVKGWIPMRYDGKQWVEYEGSDDAIGVSIDATNFPDENFRNYLLSKDYDKDGVFTEEEIEGITFINVSCKEISSLKGIEFFTALTILDCYSNQLTALDVSKNTALTYLDCHNNQLTALDLSKNTALKSLECGGNQLTALDVLKNTALTYLACPDNQLTALDVSKNSALTELYCVNDQLTALDVSKNTALITLYCHYNQLTALDVSKNTALTGLACNYNQLTALDVSKNTALKFLYCDYNQLTSLDVSKNTALTNLDCYRNNIKGAAMDALIGSLPYRSSGGKFYVYDNSNNNEGNICTKSQVAAAKAKGWTAYYGNGFNWEQYEGSEDTIVPTIITLPSSITIKVGETVLLTPTIYPEGAETALSGVYNADGTIRLSYYNNNTQFLISGIKEGNSYVVAKTANGLTSRCDITVSGYNPTAKGDGTRSNPYNAVGAFLHAASLPYNEATAERYYVKGKVLEIKEQFGTKYSNATFYLSDDGTIKNSFHIYRTNYLNNKFFEEGDDTLKVGDEVLIYGKMVFYYNDTNGYSFIPEMASNQSYIVSINGKGEQASEQDVIFSSAGYATFYSSESAYTLPNGLSAQVVTSVANGKLTYKTIADGSVSGIVPKGTAVMLVSDAKRAGTYTLTPSESSASYNGTNLLRGSDDATMTTGDGYHYKLSYGRSGSSLNNVFGWYWGASNGGSFQIDGHKAWLVVPKSSATRGYSIGDEATGISDVEDDDADAHYYDLQGRSVSKPQRKGVYIKNGQRVIIK